MNRLSYLILKKINTLFIWLSSPDTDRVTDGAYSPGTYVVKMGSHVHECQFYALTRVTKSSILEAEK